MFSLLFSNPPGIAIDLGTRNLLISDQKKILFRQSTVAAQAVGEKAPLIIGDRAEQVFERDPGHYRLLKPLSRGVICDFRICTDILRHALASFGFLKNRKREVLLSIPLDVSSIEHDSFVNVMRDLGYARVECIPEPVAAAVGLVPNFLRKKGVALVDVGAGITETVIFSFGGVVLNNSVRIGGEDFERQIISFIKNRFNFEIGPRTAFYLLDILGQAHPDSYLESIELRGVNLLKRSPDCLRIELVDVEACLDALFERIVSAVLNALEKVPADLSSDLIENGIYLTGGASQFKRFIQLLEKRTGLSIHPDAQALLGVARGEIAILQNQNLKAALHEIYIEVPRLKF